MVNKKFKITKQLGHNLPHCDSLHQIFHIHCPEIELHPIKMRHWHLTGRNTRQPKSFAGNERQHKSSSDSQCQQHAVMCQSPSTTEVVSASQSHAFSRFPIDAAFCVCVCVCVCVAFAKLQKATVGFLFSVCPHGTARLQVDWFSSNLCLSKEDVPTWCKQFYYDFFSQMASTCFGHLHVHLQEFLYI